MGVDRGVARRTAHRLVVGTRFEPIVRRVLRRPDRLWWEVLDERYDEQMREVMRRVLRPESNCLDIGAHKGTFVEEMTRLAPLGQHHAFEPLPDLAERLRMRFPKVEVHELALAATTGTQKFCWFVDDPGWSGLQQDRYERKTTDAEARAEWIDVNVARLDDVLPADLPVAFIKLDANGGEVDILTGAARALRTWRPFIAFEHGEAAIYYGKAKGSVYEPLADAGLNVTSLDRWLAGEEPLTRQQFLYDCEHRHFFWLAYP